MNIIIPLGGKGERFSKNKYTKPKPLVKIFEKCMIEYVLDNLKVSDNDKIFIIYNYKLDDFNFNNFIKLKYPKINLIKINDTKGPVETLYLGIEHIINNFTYNDDCLILDCDTFYTQDIVTIFRNFDKLCKNESINMVFYTKNYEENAIYSYIEMNDSSYITNIKEKEKISHNANTGAYAFTNIKNLYSYCKYVLDNNITYKNEPYTSCVISEMIKSNIKFIGYELDYKHVFSLGTPEAVKKYEEYTHAFLFDLDGTLVITDNIYYDVWYKILLFYNIILTKELFQNFIQGNNDKYVTNTLLLNVNVSLTEISTLKDKLFIENIHKIKIMDGLFDLINEIKLYGHKIAIVTNCNKNVANEIIKHIKMEHLIDFTITNDDCKSGKPNPEPYLKAIDKYNIKNEKCIIFEDSKSGILSGKSVNPKLLIGLETNYNNNELLNYGVNISIKNFKNFDINKIINYELNSENVLINMIKTNSLFHPIKDILIDDKKLKGGFIADVISFKIIQENNVVSSLVLKFENDNNNNLSIMAKRLDLYEREYYFYTHISSKININIPTFHGLIVNENLKNCGIMLENLTEKQFKINLNLNNESIDVTLQIVDRMAKMHAKFWNKNLKSIFPKLKQSVDECFCPYFVDFIKERIDIFKSKWYIILNDSQREICNNIFNNFSNIQKKFSIGRHLTLIHGDIKSPNIFYDVENNYEPYFIDWQHCAIGKGVQDLIFFIIESFDILNIEITYNLTKNYYYKKLIEYGVSNYTIKEYENDLHDAVCYIPFFTCIWFGTIPQDELIDKNFPYFLISKMFYLLQYIQNKLDK
jgi:HAD superfamily hydrolase (TIGR01509 family)